MTDENTADAIVAKASESRSNLAALDHMLQSAIDKIVLGAATRGQNLSDAERKQRSALRAQQADVQEAFTELGFATVARLDQSDEVKQLQKKLNSINSHLGDDLDRLKEIAAFAAIAAKVADGLTKLAEQVAGAVAKV
jgi:hypothetical protein